MRADKISDYVPEVMNHRPNRALLWSTEYTIVRFIAHLRHSLVRARVPESQLQTSRPPDFQGSPRLKRILLFIGETWDILFPRLSTPLNKK